jgi:hypothetical protein
LLVIIVLHDLRRRMLKLLLVKLIVAHDSDIRALSLVWSVFTDDT